MPTNTPAPTAATPEPSALEWLQLDRQLCFALYSSSLAMTRLYKPLLEPLGLTYPQYLVLLVLWEQDDQSVGTLGERLFLDSGTLTPLLKRMQVAGWVQRERATDDERRVQVRLTDAGRALRDQACPLPPQLLSASGCAAHELQQLTQTLQALRGRLLGAAQAAASNPAAAAVDTIPHP